MGHQGASARGMGTQAGEMLKHQRGRSLAASGPPQQEGWGGAVLSQPGVGSTARAFSTWCKSAQGGSAGGTLQAARMQGGRG